MPKYVVSSTLKDPSGTTRRCSTGDLAEEVSKLREEVDGDIVVHGSAQLVQALIEHGLVDELRLMVFPVVLGSGKRLFGETSDKKPLRLTDSKTVGDGVAIQIYEPARAAPRPAGAPARSGANSVIASASSSGASVIGMCPTPRM